MPYQNKQIMKHEITSKGITLGELPEARQNMVKYYNGLLQLTSFYKQEKNHYFRDLVLKEIERVKLWLSDNKI